MVLTITTTLAPASDLGYLLHKNPGRVHTEKLSFGEATLFYPEASETRCTAAIIVEVDPVRLSRRPEAEHSLEPYVNDRPYTANSFLSSTIAAFLSTAMGGRSKERQELADTPIPLEVRIPVITSQGGESFLRALFEPLGYELEIRRLPLDERFPGWGESAYYDVTLRATIRLAEMLTHIYVLIPVLDPKKHYYINRDEVDRLLMRGGTWLKSHPMAEIITRRYLSRSRVLAQEALLRLRALEDDDTTDEETPDEEAAAEPETPALALHDQRLHAAYEVLKRAGPRVLDLGCGEGRLLKLLLQDKAFSDIVGMDVSFAQLQKAQRRLKLDRLPERQAQRITLLHGSLVYRDRRLEGFDGAAIVEVIEHLDAPRLQAFERCVFEFARPRTVAITTPNKEYNAAYGLEEEDMRHRDHRFEWTRAEFAEWAQKVAETHGYSVAIEPIGTLDEALGAPSQMAVFREN